MIIKQNHVLCSCILMMTLIAGWGCRAEEAGSGEAVQAIAAVPENELCVWGEVLYGTEYQLNIDFPAVVKFINVTEGDWAVKGEPLVLLDDSESEHLIAKLESRKLAAESALNNTYQDTSGIEAQIARARRDITDARKDVDNYQALHNEGAVSTETLNKYIAALNSCQTDLKVLEAQLEEAKKNNDGIVDGKTDELESIIRDLNIYQNKKNKEYLSNGVIICHLDNAIIKSIYVKNESLLGSESAAVMEIIDADTIYLSAEVDEEFIKAVSIGDGVRIIPSMNPEVELSGTISQIAAMATEKNGNRIVKVRIVFDNPEFILKPGYTADIYISRKGSW